MARKAQTFLIPTIQYGSIVYGGLDFLAQHYHKTALLFLYNSAAVLVRRSQAYIYKHLQSDSKHIFIVLSFVIKKIYTD